MENIFYGALALHIAGKPVSKENIRAILRAAGTPVNEPVLEAMAAFVEALEDNRKRRESFDPRIIKFLTSELARRRVQTEKIETLLTELERCASPMVALEETAGRASEETIDLDEIIGGEMGRTAEVLGTEVPAEDSGRYVYGIAASRQAIEMGRIGIENSLVYTIPYQDICAIVHRCPPKPYESKSEETVRTWVQAHQGVLDEAKRRFGTVIPLGFDTIVRPQDSIASHDKVVEDWLKEDYDRLVTIMKKIEGKDEYGVQVFYDPAIVGPQISGQSDRVRQIKEEMAAKSAGTAYIYRQKMEKAIKAETEKHADEWFREFYDRIRSHADDIVVERTRKAAGGKVMLLNFSCLVAKEKVESLGEELDEINRREGFSVRFSGPWQPYSFVSGHAIVPIGRG